MKLWRLVLTDVVAVDADEQEVKIGRLDLIARGGNAGSGVHNALKGWEEERELTLVSWDSMSCTPEQWRMMIVKEEA